MPMTPFFRRNLPTTERAVRLVLAACLAWATHRFAPSLATQLLGHASAATLAATAGIGFCPACAMFGRKPGAPRP